MYDYENLEKHFQAETGWVDPEAEKKKPFFTLRFDFALFRVLIKAVENYELDLSDGNFDDLIGFEKKLFKDEKTFVGTKIRDITSRGQLSLRLEFHAVNKSTINLVGITITDGRNNSLDLNGLDVALSLMIEEG